MAILTDRAVAATVDALVLKVRRMIGDTDSSTANQRWSDADVRAAIDDMLAQMYAQASSGDPGSFLTYIDVMYAANARQVALDDEILGASIYKVEDVTEATAPRFIPFRPSLVENRFSDEAGWTLDADNTIALRPVPGSAKTLRVYLLDVFVPLADAADTDSDQHAWSIGHEELIALGAAIRLQEVDQEVPATRLSRYQQLWDLYVQSINRYMGPVYVRNSRILL